MNIYRNVQDSSLLFGNLTWQWEFAQRSPCVCVMNDDYLLKMSIMMDFQFSMCVCLMTAKNPLTGALSHPNLISPDPDKSEKKIKPDLLI